MGNCCRRRDYKEKTVRDMKMTEKLAESKSINTLDRFSSPTELQTSQLTDVYELPTEKFKTKYDVIEHYGYKMGPIIGEGSYAKVFKAQNLTENITVAVKITEPVDRNHKRYWIYVRNELFILQKIRHRNIVQVIEHFIIDTNLYIFMEYASGGTLDNLLFKNGSFSENESKELFGDILCGVERMHNENIAHRDLKMANILIGEDGRLLISDFGLSRVVYRKEKEVIQTDTICGTQPFMSPELLAQRLNNPFLSDIWALGVILFCLLNARYPFCPIRDKYWIVRRQMKRKWSFSPRAKHKPTPEVMDILNKMLEPELEKRIEIKDLVKQKWIQKDFIKAQKLGNTDSQQKVNKEIMKTTVS